MITSIVIGSGKGRKVIATGSHHARDVHRSLRQDDANAIKDYLFGRNEPGNRKRNRAFKRGATASKGG